MVKGNTEKQIKLIKKTYLFTESLNCFNRKLKLNNYHAFGIFFFCEFHCMLLSAKCCLLHVHVLIILPTCRQYNTPSSVLPLTPLTSYNTLCFYLSTNNSWTTQKTWKESKASTGWTVVLEVYPKLNKRKRFPGI